jgi:hypothetical protein
MDYKIVNPSNGRSGGVMLLWKKEVVIQQIFSAPKYIDVQVIEASDKIWRLTGMYGERKWEDKYKNWDKIRELNSNSSLPWALIGDFNEILFSHEKEGGSTRRQGYMQAFRDAMSDCGLEDLGFSGDVFTWKRGQIRQRLDRAIANGQWMNMHPGAVLQHLGYIRSDHWPILLDTKYQAGVGRQKHGPRRFEAKWLREEGFRQVVEDAWEASGASSTGVLERLARLHAAMHEWDSTVLKQPRKRLRKAQRELDDALSSQLTEESEKKAKELANLIESLLEQEEVYWSQRSQANWIQHGDRNTLFFHNYASARRKKNFITKLKDEAENWVEGTDALKPPVLNYFTNLFTSEVQETDPDFLEKVQPRVTHMMNEKLTAPFMAEDVKKAMFSIGDFKAPGPDGLHVVFGTFVGMKSHRKFF